MHARHLLNRRGFLKGLGLGAAAMAMPAWLRAAGAEGSTGRSQKKPNIVVVFTDDQGYGDLGCFGSKAIGTPRIDAMAKQGLKLTSFYAQPVCGPSRSALLSGCYPPRVATDGKGWGLAGKTVTVAEVLKDAGYATACIGKWDVSNRRDKPGMMPNDQGFDYYFGTWGANDGGGVSLVRNRDRVEKTRDMAKLTGLYTDEAIKFINQHKDGPFFLYLAHTMAHVIIDASSQFKGKSQGDLYGDVIEEIDWNTGRVIDTIEQLGLAKDTIVLFTTDNGPWCNQEDKYRRKHGGHLATGSTGPLRGSKGTCWEGGVRVPCVAWGPGRIPPGRVNDGIVGTIDLLPTFAALGGGKLPGYGIDGVDQSALLTGKADESARDRWFYFHSGALTAVRKNEWKLFVRSKELYNLEKDLGEQKNAAEENPGKVEELLKLTDWAKSDLRPIQAVVGAPKSK